MYMQVFGRCQGTRRTKRNPASEEPETVRAAVASPPRASQFRQSAPVTSTEVSASTRTATQRGPGFGVTIHLPPSARERLPQAREGILESEGFDVPAQRFLEVGDRLLLGRTLAVRGDVGHARGEPSLGAVGDDLDGNLLHAPSIQRLFRKWTKNNEAPTAPCCRPKPVPPRAVLAATGRPFSATLEGMEPVHDPAREPSRSIDVTGLPEEAIRAVELLVSHLRGQGAARPSGAFSSYEEWAKEFHAWMEEVAARAGRYPPGFMVDDSRETIYEGRGE